MAEIDYDLLARKVAEILKNDSQGVGEIPKVDSLQDVYSLPANRKRPDAEDEHEVVEVPMILLQQPALDAAEVANTAADNADAKAVIANTAASLANEKASLADVAAANTNKAIENAQLATGSANAAAASANQAAITANTAADNADAKAELAQEKADYANEVASHQPYPDVYGNWWVWDPKIKDYIQTDVNLMGKPWTITKKYPSKEAMEADVNNPKVPEGAFVTITVPSSDGEGADVNKPDTAAVYLKTKDSEGNFIYSFFTDFSGAQGFEGKTPMFRPGTMTVGEAGSQVKMTLSPDGEDSDGNPIYKMNFTIPRGNPGAPFQVKGQYTTLEELQAAIPDGSTVEGFIAVGDKIPYDYYAWVNGAWVDQGKIVGEGGGKMVLIPSAVLNLTNTSTSNEILDAFGSKEAFIDIVRKVKEGAPLAIRQGNSYGALIYALVNFNAGIEPEQGIYQLGFTFINSLPDEKGNFAYVFNLQNDVIQLVLKEETPLGYANIVNIPPSIFSLNSDSTSDQIITAFGGKAFFDSIIEKVRVGNAIGIISEPSISISIEQIEVTDYIDANNVTLVISFTVGGGVFAINIIVSNGVFAYIIVQYRLLVAESLVSDPSTGGTDRPASAEAVKTLNDTKVSSTNIRSIQKLTQAEYDALATKDDNTLYIIVN